MKKSKMIQVVGYFDREIEYQKIWDMAFDSDTPEALSIHYRQTLLNVQDILAHYEGVTMDRLIFLINPKTQRTTIWLD